MQKSWSDIRESITTPLMGFTIVVLFLACFLLAMVVLVSVVRVLMG
jgi:Na+-transporting methylmalonyl-CoA/oxaloacetate decarboxylase gamma subunit